MLGASIPTGLNAKASRDPRTSTKLGYQNKVRGVVRPVAFGPVGMDAPNIFLKSKNRLLGAKIQILLIL